MKIAIVGSKPDTYNKIPLLNDEWEIWRFSRRNYNKPPHFDRWFELHNKKHFPRYEIAVPGYVEFLKTDPRVVLQQHFPWQRLLEEFGPYFFSGGQAPWMMAYAISLEPDEIGLWGIDPTGDYKPQRSEIQHFIQVARDRAIKVIAPEDEILKHRPLYALETDTITALLKRLGYGQDKIDQMFADPPKWDNEVAQAFVAATTRQNSATPRDSG